MKINKETNYLEHWITNLIPKETKETKSFFKFIAGFDSRYSDEELAIMEKAWYAVPVKKTELERNKARYARMEEVIHKLRRATGVTLQFREINSEEERKLGEVIHTVTAEFDAPGDIYKTFQTIQAAVINEFIIDWGDINYRIKQLEREEN